MHEFQSSHTPGPWHSTQGLYGRPDEWTIWGAKNTSGCSEKVAILDNSQDHDEPNASLIESAPELLAALKVCQTRLFMLDGSGPEYEQAGRAIDHAQGRSEPCTIHTEGAPLMKANVRYASIADLYAAKRLANLEGTYASPCTGLCLLLSVPIAVGIFVAWMLL